MKEAQFEELISIIYSTGMSCSAISTGLPAVDPSIQEMKYIRTIEILEN